MSGIVVRDAVETDAEALSDLFALVYAGAYPFTDFLDRDWLLRSLYRDDVHVIVAEDEADGRLLGTGSVVFDLGTDSDLLGEFGRLAVHPNARGRGVGRLLMEGRCRFAAPRMHVGIAQNRCVHSFSQRISHAAGFAPVGFLPLKYQMAHRESVVLWARHFGHALQHRNNHPRVVPEVQGLATLSLRACGLDDDVIVCDSVEPLPPAIDVHLEELTDRGMPALLRIERGRVRQRGVFGPLRLHFGLFQIRARRASYVVARSASSGALVGAIGFVHDEHNAGLQVFELIAREAELQATLLRALLDRANELDAVYVEVDVGAHASRLQRTLLEMGFLPAAYVPAMVFDEVDRIDVVKFVHLTTPMTSESLDLLPGSRAVADQVLLRIANRAVLPEIEAKLHDLALFAGLSTEQARRVASHCTVRKVAAQQRLFGPGDDALEIFVPLNGRCSVRSQGQPIGHLRPGEAIGERAMLLGHPHTAEVIALEPATMAVLERTELERLQRQRPDIALQLYRNLAQGLSRKLGRT